LTDGIFPENPEPIKKSYLVSCRIDARDRIFLLQALKATKLSPSELIRRLIRMTANSSDIQNLVLTGGYEDQS